MTWHSESPEHASPNSPGPDPRLDELCQTYGPKLLPFLLRATAGDPSLADKLMRETLRRAWPLLQPLGSEIDDAETWLSTIAFRVAIDHLRTARSPAGDPSAESMIDAHDVRAALGRLGSTQRRVVVEIYGRGRSVPETARLLGLSPAAVRRQAYGALRALRPRTDPPGPGRSAVA